MCSPEEERELLQVSFEQMLPAPPAANAAGEQAGAGDAVPAQKPWMCYNVTGLVGKLHLPNRSEPLLKIDKWWESCSDPFWGVLKMMVQNVFSQKKSIHPLVMSVLDFSFGLPLSYGVSRAPRSLQAKSTGFLTNNIGSLPVHDSGRYTHTGSGRKNE